MEQYMTVKEYCEATGMKTSVLRKLLNSHLAEEFSFRSGNGKTSNFYIRVGKLEKMLDRGDLKEVLES